MKNHIKYILSLSFCLCTTIILAQVTAVSGQILKKDDVAVTDVMVELSGNNYNRSVNLDDQGNYVFDDVPVDIPLTIVVKKVVSNPLNGVSTFDLALTTRHILGVNIFTEIDQYIAMDANKSGVVTAFDLIQFRRLILGLTPVLPNNDAWRFIENQVLATLSIEGDELVGDPTPATTFNANANQTNIINFTAIKVGDANGNAM